MADISELLLTIKNAVYGEDMRTAIHDALNKINLEGGGTTDTYTQNEVDILLSEKINNTEGSVSNSNIADNAISLTKFADEVIVNDGEVVETVGEYTNLVPISVDTTGEIYNDVGYKDNTRLGSDGTDRENSGAVVSGFIPFVRGDILRIKGGTWSSTNGTCLIIGYGSDFSKIFYGSFANLQLESFGSATYEDGLLYWDSSKETAGNFSSLVTYIRFSCDGTGKNLIATKNEEIISTEVTKDSYVLSSNIKVKSENIIYSDQAVEEVKKEIACFGDSIFGMYRDETSVVSYIEKNINANTYNLGFGGCRMSVHPTSGYAEFCMWALALAVSENNFELQESAAASGSDYFSSQLELLKSIDFNAIDTVLIHYGTNDFTANINLDNESDLYDYNTVCGALRYSVNKLLLAYPHLNIIVSLPTYRFWTVDDEYISSNNYTNSLGKTLIDYVNALLETAKSLNCQVIDNYYNNCINDFNASTFLEDGVHHNQLGRQRLGEYIAKCI